MSQLTSSLFARPAVGDCDPYYFNYIDLIPEDVDVATLLHTQREWFGDFVELLTPEQAKFSYAPGKWTLAEMIGHVMDTERVFSYRMMAISRNDQNLFPGFEQDVHGVEHDDDRSFLMRVLADNRRRLTIVPMRATAHERPNAASR